MKYSFEKKARVTLIEDLMRYQDVETGGVLLGYVDENEMRIVETVTGGEKALREPGAFEYDYIFVETVCENLSLKYNPPLSLVGLWHKHNHTLEPAFSMADKDMHEKLLELCDKGISCLFQKREDGKYQLQIMDAKKKIIKDKSLWM